MSRVKVLQRKVFENCHLHIMPSECAAHWEIIAPTAATPKGRPFKSLSKVFKRLQKCFKGLLNVFKGSFKGISKVLLRLFKHI